MYILAYKIAEKFGTELLKTAALVAVSALAGGVAGALTELVIEKIHGNSATGGGGGTCQEAVDGEIDIMDLISREPEAAKPAINITLNVNSYNERNTDTDNVREDVGTVINGPATMEQGYDEEEEEV